MQSFLHPDLKADALPEELHGLESLRDLLCQSGGQLQHLVPSGSQPLGSPNRIGLLAAVLDLLTQLGWKPTNPRIWEQLAEMADPLAEKRHFLRRALQAAESVLELERLREHLLRLTDKLGSARSGNSPHQQSETPST